ncbi:hypothetical protein [Bradyrhizobium elkanii]|uniref:hypothetical protein n=1 Tax=Bradyrhizobium elkanii TaxID=29448 RepID=UPI00056E0A62|nr:hypothetical protein [Bradyrhizobium elkanii]WLA79614.1 hypothetical protein QNJ99_29985 [Bradyrhizobium elkanii]
MRLDTSPLVIAFLTVAGIATVGATVAVRASRERPPAIEQSGRVRPPVHVERLQETVVSRKQDRLPLPARSETSLAEHIAPDVPAHVPPVVMSLQPDKPVTKRGRHVERNICTRHGKRKVRHGRYGWRCR